MEIVIATGNAHKVEEYSKILAPFNFKCLSLKDINLDIDVEETGSTFEENSLIKAQAIAKYTNKVVLADDSGLIVDALPGMLGVYSHRFFGEDTSYFQKNNEVLRLLKDRTDRSARFVCCITIMNLKDEPLQFVGTCEGTIGYKIEGEHGFGFDPIFVANGYDVSIATVSDEEKNSISHRGNASKKLIQYLKENNY